MSDIVKNLVNRIARFGDENRIGIGQTLATKLIYLIEWDYYRWHGKRLTDLDWIFFHYGPWSKKLSTILNEQSDLPNDETEPKQFRKVNCEEHSSDDKPIRFEPDLEGTVQRVLEHFGTEPLNEVISYVYFNTEPMENATRGQPLVFSTIRKAQEIKSPASGLNKKVRQQIKEQLASAVSAESEIEIDKSSSISGEISELLEQLDVADFKISEGVEIILPNTEEIKGNWPTYLQT